MECEFCKSTLSSLSNLNYHKKTNKKCLKIQDKTNNEINSSLINCEYCNKSLSLSNMNKHVNVCRGKIIKEKEFLEIEIKNLKDEIETLKNKNTELKENIIKLNGQIDIYKDDRGILNDIARQPKSTTTNITNNLSVFDDEIIKLRFVNALNNVKPSDFYDGQQSIGRIMAPCLQNEDGTKMITCSDFSRGVFIKKDKNGNISKDIKCRNLSNAVEPIASAKAEELIRVDKERRIKSFNLKELEEKIKKRTIEINNLRDTLLGFKKDSHGWNEYQNTILMLENQNEIDNQEIEKLKNDGVTLIENDEFCDVKLLEAADDIKEMRTDSSKFSKALSEIMI